MTYILAGTQAPAPVSNAALMALGNTLLSAVGETIKQGIKSGFTRYQVYNLMRFNDANIKDPQLTARMDKGDYTLPFKAYREGIGKALKVGRAGARVPAREINDAAFEGFKAVYNMVLDVQDTTSKQEDKKLEPKTAEDNTTLYVGLAALALGAVVLARKSPK
jgi:hypothetical protein